MASISHPSPPYFFVPTEAPTPFPTNRPTNTPPPKQVFMTAEQDQQDLRPESTRPPGMIAPPPVSAMNPAYLPSATTKWPTMNPASPTIVIQNNPTFQAAGYREEHVDIINPNHREAQTGPSDMILYRLKYQFFKIDREPKETEIQSLICATEDFFAEELDGLMKKYSDLTMKAIDVQWDYNGLNDEYPLELRFAAHVWHGSNFELVPENDVFQILKVSDEDLHRYMTEYLWNIVPDTNYDKSVFYEVKKVFFKSSQNVEIPEGTWPQGTNYCPPPRPNQTPPGGSNGAYGNGGNNEKPGMFLLSVRYSCYSTGSVSTSSFFSFVLQYVEVE